MIFLNISIFDINTKSFLFRVIKNLLNETLLQHSARLEQLFTSLRENGVSSPHAMSMCLDWYKEKAVAGDSEALSKCKEV